MTAKNKKINLAESQVAYQPQGYSNPYGSSQFSAGGWLTTPSAENQQQISSRQALINQLLPELNTTSDNQVNQINQQRDLMYDQLTKYAIPQYYNELASRGLGNSSAMSQGLNDLMTKAGTQAIFGADDLYNQSLQRKLQSGQFAQSGLNDIYAQMMGIQNSALANTGQYMSNAQTNAQRLYEGQVGNRANANQQSAATMNDLGTLAGVAAAPFTGGASLALTGMGGGGGQTMNPYSYLGYGGGSMAPTGNLAYDNSMSQGYANTNPYSGGYDYLNPYRGGQFSANGWLS